VPSSVNRRFSVLFSVSSFAMSVLSYGAQGNVKKRIAIRKVTKKEIIDLLLSFILMLGILLQNI
jgi:hypothetical protein